MISPGVIEFHDIPEPGPLKDNEILLRIKKIGVCGSDIHVFHGKHPATPYPVVQGAMIEPAAVGAHSTNRVTGLKGKNVVVSGAGTIGNLVAQFAKARGAEKVLITDVSDYRLDIARKCGIDGTANVKETPFAESVQAFFGDDSFQVGLSLFPCLQKVFRLLNIRRRISSLNDRAIKP
jgi:threonine dehydrogenase-like Zn-dependent dehydrogenase